MKPLVDIQHLTVAYDEEPVLQEVNLQIADRDFIGMIGPNGGGKTTLLKAILGLVKPLAGSIVFRDDLPRTQRPFGYLPQVKHLDKKFPITVTDVVRSGALMCEKPFRNKREELEKALSLLDEMGVADIRHKAIGELSGGQMQRVFLCRALLSNPRLLILDEPDTFVDNRFEGELYEKLRQLNREMAILLVSHDVGTISGYVKTIACVNRFLHYHPSNIITARDLEIYNCPLQIIFHGEVPHTVLKTHHHE